MRKVKENIIMDKEDIQRTIKRIAYQIYENNIDEKELIIAGIAQSGLTLANRIIIELNQIESLNVELIEIKVDKKNPRNKVSISQDLEFCEGKSVVIVDDVLNTGRTLIYAVRHFLSIELKHLQTAVLVNRNHKSFPIKGDFKGMSLSTTIKERIDVRFGDEEGVYLS